MTNNIAESIQIETKIRDGLNQILNGLSNDKRPLKNSLIEFFNNDLSMYLLSISKIHSNSNANRAHFESISDELIQKANNLDLAAQNKILMKRVKRLFRTLVGPWIYQSLILKRAFEKPRGYPGDYELLEMIYDNIPVTDKSIIIGYYSDIHFLHNELANAVRERKDKMVEYLKEYISANRAKALNILNVASGSAREIRELQDSFKMDSYITFNCLDFDQEALDYSKQQLTSSDKIKFNFIKKDIVELITNKSDNKLINPQDLVYSIGLIDYLPNRILKSFIQYSYSLLTKNGSLILSHKDCSKVSTLVEDWWCDWTFYERSKDEVLGLFQDAGIDKQYITLSPLKSDGVYYLVVEKH